MFLCIFVHVPSNLHHILIKFFINKVVTLTTTQYVLMMLLCFSYGRTLLYILDIIARFDCNSHRLMPSHWYSYNNPAALRRQAELPQLQLLALFLILNACFGFIEQNPADNYVPSASPTASSVTSRAFARKPRRQQHISNTLCWGPLRFERSDVGFIHGNSQIAILIAWNAHNIHEPKNTVTGGKI